MRVEVEVNAGRLAALSAAPPEPAGSVRNETVLFVPGYTGSKEDFQPLLQPLADHGYRSLAIDQRGQFESSWAPERDHYTLAGLAADVIEVAHQLRPVGAALHLVGHSFGGLVGRAAVLARGDLFDSFTLMGSGPAAIGGRRRQLMDAGESVLAEYGMSALWELMEARPDAKYEAATPAALSFLRTRFLANDPVGLEVMGTQLRTAADHTAALAGTGVPLLVLYGVDDDAWPPELQLLMARRLGAARVVVPAAAHSPAVENPTATLTALLTFWQSLAQTRPAASVPNPAQLLTGEDTAAPSGHSLR